MKNKIAMRNTKKLKDRLKEKIDNLSEDKLNHVFNFLNSIEIGTNRSKILSYAGNWNDIDEETFNEFTKDLEDRRKSNRTRIF